MPFTPPHALRRHCEEPTGRAEAGHPIALARWGPRARPMTSSGDEAIFPLVTTGLDPVVHADSRLEKTAQSARDVLPKIAPSWIHRANQIDLPLARPMLDIFLALNG
jgi:hypothetical protein